jgi:hypothetical protein
VAHDSARGPPLHPTRKVSAMSGYKLALEALVDKGILLMINTQVFHPRGVALSIVLDDNGRPAGFEILGDGTERWDFDDDPIVDEKWKAFNKMLNEAMTANLIGE